MSFFFYAWMSAAAPDRWPPERARLWAGGSAALCVTFSAAVVYFVVALIRHENRKQ
jgi:hypothetical protein